MKTNPSTKSQPFHFPKALFASLSSLLWYDNLSSHLCRYYEKSIIEQAINQERSNMASHWEETKKSIRDARYRLSLSNHSEAFENNKHAKQTEVNKES